MRKNPFIVLLILTVIFWSCKSETKTESDEEHPYTNSLVNETSPYLLQHAHNPVDWQPWSQEALQRAEKENKLVLVSIGYSSCHWCHVMEEETFENEAVATLMNKKYISIKVDREERPDVDQVYQNFQRLTGGNTGWPLNVIVLPNGKPLYGGTYHSKDQWSQVLTKFSDMYKNDPKKAAEYTDMVAKGIQEENLIQPATDFVGLSQEKLKAGVENWKPNWDLQWGGNKGIEKFMTPTNLIFLLEYVSLTADETAKTHLKNTLDKMAMGGVYDHIGGGFFRYSTDAQWKLPHFEKMLYDNAQVLSLYSKAYQVFKNPNYFRIVSETAMFLEREMKNPDGGYYAAIDSESDGEEGKFYVWTEAELKTALTADFELFASYYNIKPEAVWEDGNYVLHNLIQDIDFLKSNSISQADLNAAKEKWKNVLLKYRMKREPPRTDDKIITSWNSLLIKGFVDAFKATGQQVYLDRAEGVFNFLKSKSYERGQLVHSFKKESKRKEGFLEDYAFLTDAALKLYGVTMKKTYLDFAKELERTTQVKFADTTSGMYHYNEGQELIVRIIKTDDGEIPSPNAVMAHNLFELGHIEYDTVALKKSKMMLSTMLPSITENAFIYSHWNTLFLHQAYPFFEIAVVGNNAAPLVQKINQNYIPNALVVGTTAESELPLFKDRYSNYDTYIYICQNSTCKLPVKSVEEALEQLANF